MECVCVGLLQSAIHTPDSALFIFKHHQLFHTHLRYAFYFSFDFHGEEEKSEWKSRGEREER